MIYQKISNNNYELCANFKRASSEYKEDNARGYNNINTTWDHKAGKYCFDKNVIEKNNPIEKAPISLSVSQGELESQLSSKIARVKSTMASVVPMAIICQDESGEVISGKGNNNLCTSKDQYVWPTINLCGPNPEDTQWFVLNGNTEEWSVLLSCRKFPLCDGSSNALCNKDGCTFGGNCQYPKK